MGFCQLCHTVQLHCTSISNQLRPANMKTAIIDKSPVLMEGLGQLLRSQYQISDLFTCVSLGVLREQYPEAVPNLIIIEMSKILHDSNLAIIGAVKSFFPNASVIAIGEVASLPVVIDFLRAGAMGYLTYSVSPREVLRCVSNVLEGKMFVPDELLPLIIRAQEKPLKKVTKTRLTYRERHIAGLLIKDQKAAEIALQLGVKPATIFATKRTIFTKLKIDSIFQLKRALEELSWTHQ